MSENIGLNDGWANLYVREDGSVLLVTNTSSGRGFWERRYDFPAGSAPLIASILGVAPDDCQQYLVSEITAQREADSLLGRIAAGGLIPIEGEEYFN
jgi:hypothetical protein